MRKLISMFKNKNNKRTPTQEIYREWNRQRRNAYGPSDLAEIDAIFTRALSE